MILLKKKKLNEVQSDPPCFKDKGLTKYLNRQDVKNAMHVKSDITWSVCSDSVGDRYEISEEGSYYLYPELIKSGLRILIFSGDTDLAVPTIGNQRWIDELKLQIIKPWKPWRAYGDKQVIAGYRTVYKGLTFATIKGTGHMVPQWKRKEAFYMIDKFLNNQDL